MMQAACYAACSNSTAEQNKEEKGHVPEQRNAVVLLFRDATDATTAVPECCMLLAFTGTGCIHACSSGTATAEQSKKLLIFRNTIFRTFSFTFFNIFKI